MLLTLSSIAHAAGTAPEDRVEVTAESGLVTRLGAVGFGLGGGFREQAFTLVATGGFGGRIDLDGGGPSQPGYGLGSLALGLDAPTEEGARMGVALLTDWVVLDTEEQGCTPRFGCRHAWFVGTDGPPGLGIGVSPAIGARISGSGPSGARYSSTLGWQPSLVEDEFEWWVPRLDFALWSERGGYSLHAWAGRYGLGLGLGYRLFGPKS